MCYLSSRRTEKLGRRVLSRGSEEEAWGEGRVCRPSHAVRDSNTILQLPSSPFLGRPDPSTPNNKNTTQYEILLFSNDGDVCWNKCLHEVDARMLRAWTSVLRLESVLPFGKETLRMKSVREREYLKQRQQKQLSQPLFN